jgi:hypothetical protein
MVATISPVTPPSHLSTHDPEFDRLLNPAQFYEHPDDVLGDRQLSPQEKRAILSSWASDACAVESMPAWRQIPGAPHPVSFDAVMEALQRLDRLGPPRGTPSRTPVSDRARHPAT